ncbi:MAG: ThuA domain-containing protein [Phycisphaerae bacterium]
MSSANAMVLVAGTDRYHDLLAAGRALQDVLLGEGWVAPVHMGLDRFDDREFSDAEVAVVYAMRPRPRQTAQDALTRRVEEGLGLVAIHSANVVDDAEEFRTYTQLIGSRFNRHDPFDRLAVSIDQPDHPITRGVADFTIEDEPYECDMLVDDAEVLASHTRGGKTLPMVYVRTHGKGRVCYLALGHDRRAWGHPAFQQLLRQATNWVAGYDG